MRFIRRQSKLSREAVKNFAEQIGRSEVMAELLLQRGIDTAEKAQEFFSSDRLLDPFLFERMQETVELIAEMIEAEVPIAIYSDYDCDGVCGASIMYLALKKLGAEVRVYIPDRFTEGYGTNARAIELLADEAGLIITVDCGIVSVEDVALARDLGAEVIILDHHECGEVLPDTPYILNPKRPGEPYPNKHLCGAGIAFKVACALLGDEALRLVDLAGIATIGDIVSLTGENRVIASMGLKKLREAPNPGIRALLTEANLDPEKITSYGVSFVIVPRINAAGRLEHAIRAFDLITTSGKTERLNYAKHIHELNDQRKVIQKNISVLAEEQVLQTKDRIIVVRGENFHKGVVGLAASRIAEHYYRPTIVLSEENGVLTGSARSIEGVNIHEIMSSMAHLYTRFGGHSQAAGVTLPAEYFEEFRAGLNACAEKLPEEVFRRKQYYDAELDAAKADLELVDELKLMEPFGLDNASPVFLLRDAEVSNVVKMGKNREHTRCRTGNLSCIRFGGSLIEGMSYDLLGALSVNEFNGVRSAQFTVNAAQPRNAELTEQTQLSFLRSFPAEIRKLAEQEDKADNSCDFFGEIYRAQQESPQGTVVLVGSLPGMELMGHLPESFPVMLQDSGTDNKVLLGALPKKQYPRVFKLGAYSSKAEGEELYCRELTELYRKEAAEYFLQREELELYLGAFRQISGEFDAISQLLREVCQKVQGSSLKKAWFAMNVFFEQKLIALSKSDRIRIIHLAQNGEQGESSLYQIFESFINEAQYV